MVGIILCMHQTVRGAAHRAQETANLCGEAVQQQQQLLLSDEDVACWLRDTLKLIVDRLDVARTDLSNEKMQSIRHIVVHHGIEYERKNFERRLESGAVTLERTQTCINATVRSLALTSLQTTEDYEKVLASMGMRLVCTAPPERMQLPETLAMDKLSMQSLNAHFFSEVLCLSILVTLQLHVSAQLLEQVAAKVLRDPPVLHRKESVAACLRTVQEEIAHLDHAEAIGTMLAKHVDPGHSVFKCLVSTCTLP